MPASGKSREAPRNKTRETLLRVALRHFSEKGYRATRTQEICRESGANMASVNYHFGGKEGLYKAVWDRALEVAIHDESSSPRLSSDDDREWLYRYVHACVTTVFNTGRSGTLRKLMAAEIADPSPVSEEVLASHVVPRHAELTERLRRMLGPDVTDDQIGCCVFAINAQFSALAVNRAVRRSLFRGDAPTPEEAEQIARELCAFVMGGIRSIRGIPAEARRSRN